MDFLKITGIICEYNPLHRGHSKQLAWVRQKNGPDSGTVCLMSGNYVQRGAPAVFSKICRAQAAVHCGADLVLELPVTVALSSAEGFAAEGVRLLSGFCDRLSFGAETGDPVLLMQTAHALLSDGFSPALRAELDKGSSFPAARAAALAALGLDAGILRTPNNILAVEYCKAILAQDSRLEPLVLTRQGGYHDREADPENPSATALRSLMARDGDWLVHVPDAARDCFRDADVHTLQAGERAILARLRTMTDEEFETVPYGSEGLWRKLMHAARQEPTLDAIAGSVKSKRYTRTRIDRMLLCAFLGLTTQDFARPAPYARVLAFNDRGREILKAARSTGFYPNLGEKTGDPYESLEARCDSLYGLFAQAGPEPPAPKYRIYYPKE